MGGAGGGMMGPPVLPRGPQDLVGGGVVPGMNGMPMGGASMGGGGGPGMMSRQASAELGMGMRGGTPVGSVGGAEEEKKENRKQSRK